MPAVTRAPSQPTAARGLEVLRRRTTFTLIAGVALASTGHIAAVTIATIAAESLAGTAALAGAPGATAVFGAAVGSAAIGWLAGRRGRRIALTVGYAGAVVGALVATVALVGGSFPLFLGGMFLVGFGNSSSLAARYAAADLRPAAARASAIGTVVWAATVGAVVGPNLVPVAGDIALALGLPEVAGPYLVPGVFTTAAAVLSFVLLRPDPMELADPDSRPRAGDAPAATLSVVLRRPAVAASLVALVAGQVVMVLIMTMTPLHLTEHGHGLADVGIVISAHTFGMFALSPLSGQLTDRLGSVTIIFAGTVVLAAAAALTAIAPPDARDVIFLAMLLLGWGWNLGFVAGSTLLTATLTSAERARTQGFADALIWSSAAVASAGSGVIVAVASYATLGLLGLAIIAIPIVVVVSRRAAVELAVGRPSTPTTIPAELDVTGEL
jgi:MFS family permease